MTVPGQMLLKMINGRGGNDSDYSDIVFGTVVSPDEGNPVVQIDDKLTVLGNQVSFGSHFKERTVKINGHEQTIIEQLYPGDKVRMLRCQGGQHYVIQDKVG